MRRRFHVYALLVITVVIGVYYFSGSDKELLDIGVRTETAFGIPYRYDKFPSKIAFDEPLRRGQTVAVRKGDEVWLITLLSVSIPSASFEVIGSDGRKHAFVTSENLLLGTTSFRWGPRDVWSVFLYQDPNSSRSNHPIYSIYFPESKDELPNLISEPDKFKWNETP